jgi:3-oxoacyl-[acyl-carrier protein] reductase
MDEQTALVTGAGRGIGKAIAMELAAHGIFVCINFLSDSTAARKTLDEITVTGGRGALLPFDVTDFESTRDAIKTLVTDKGKIDILVNNAGIRADQLLAMMKPDAWHRVVNTNLNSFYNVTKPVVKNMVKNRFGRIVTVTSAAGQMGNSGQTNYSAAKAGLIGATKALAREVGNRNITVNAVAPGFIETQMLDGMMLDRLTETIPAGRLGKPEEVAHAVAFLCSERASYVNGQILGVNGGLI